MNAGEKIDPELNKEAVRHLNPPLPRWEGIEGRVIPEDRGVTPTFILPHQGGGNKNFATDIFTDQLTDILTELVHTKKFA